MITGIKEPCVFMACQIYKVTFTSLVGSRFNESSMFISLKFDYFYFVSLYKTIKEILK